MTLAQRASITQQKVMLDVSNAAAVAATTTLPLCTADGDYRVDKFEVEIPGGYTADATNYYDISLQAPRGAMTAVAATDVVTVTGHNLITGDALQFTNSGGGLPAGLTAGVTVYAVVIDANTFKVSDTNAHALAGTNIIDITTAGTGTHAAFKLMAIYSLLTGQQGTLTTLVFGAAANFPNPTGVKGDQLNVVLTKFAAGVNVAANSLFVAHLKQYNGL